MISDKDKRWFRRILKEWREFKITLTDAELRLVKRTKRCLLRMFGDENEFFTEFLTIINKLHDVDFHPFELGAYDEMDKWENINKEILEHLEKINNKINV